MVGGRACHGCTRREGSKAKILSPCIDGTGASWGQEPASCSRNTSPRRFEPDASPPRAAGGGLQSVEGNRRRV